MGLTYVVVKIIIMLMSTEIRNIISSSVNIRLHIRTNKT